MFVYRNVLIFIYALLCVNCFSQEVERTQTAKIDIQKQVKISSDNGEYLTYRLKDYLNRNSPIVKKHKKYYIDVPKGLSFKNYYYKGKVSTYVFSDSLRYFVVEIHYRNDLMPIKLTTGKYDNNQQSVIDTLPKQLIENIQNGLSYGVCSEKGKVIYYYNVDSKYVNFYNLGIGSIRERK